MVGKGSVNHNSRKFKAENVDAERSHLNVDYCNENIKKVYHKRLLLLQNKKVLNWREHYAILNENMQ